MESVCALCHDFIDPVRDSYHREVKGWLNVGSGGGGQVINRSYTGRIAHKICVRVEQPSLLGDNK